MADVSKVVFDGEVLIDLTNDTVNEGNLLKGKKAHRCDGVIITGKLQAGQIMPRVYVNDNVLCIVRGYDNDSCIKYVNSFE